MNVRGVRLGWHVAIALLFGFAMPAPTSAECVNQTNRWPDYGEVAPTAQTVVIGTVISSQREDPTDATVLFQLRVDEVVRGEPPTVMTIEGLRSGLPLRGEDACRENAFLYVHVDDVIALALDGRMGTRSGVNSAVVITGRVDEWTPGLQRMSRREAVAAARALPASDTAPVADPSALLVRAAIGAVNRGVTHDLS
jgi:hypothetical protein